MILLNSIPGKTLTSELTLTSTKEFSELLMRMLSQKNIILTWDSS